MPQPAEDFSLTETNPYLGGEKVTGSGNNQYTSSHDLVEHTLHLYVHVIKAKNLTGKDVAGTCDPYVEVRLGNYKGITRLYEGNSNPDWNEVYAFSRYDIHHSNEVLVIAVKDKYMEHDRANFMGLVKFDMKKIPKRGVPTNNPLAPQWYSLENSMGEKVKGELMLAVWMGTQADEAFSRAYWADELEREALSNIGSKIYLSPKLSYLRVNVIEAMNLQPSNTGGPPEVFVKACLGNQVLRTTISRYGTVNPLWNEELLFVAAEPFEERLILTVEQRVAPNRDELLGTCEISFHEVGSRSDYYKPVDSRWHLLDRHGAVERNRRIHVRTCLEGGYHVLDESTNYCSDFRPTAEELWKPKIGVLELGILEAKELAPMKTKDGQGTTDSYCVVKYGEKWVRTRTIINDSYPRWNEQYNWDVFDPCTVITIGVFDNCHLQGGGKSGWEKDKRIGKLRIRLSTLETNRVYTHLYPLLVLHPDGAKKMGEIHLALRFTCSSLIHMMRMYSQPLLPNMHYLHPLSVEQVDTLKHWATEIVSMRLSLSEPPLRKEVVEDMLDVEPHMWSMRRTTVNLRRLNDIFSGLVTLGKWFDQVSKWKNPSTTILIHILYVMLVMYPELILPTISLCPFLIGAWYYRQRPSSPSHLDVRLSQADSVHPDELDELFDTFPTSGSADFIKMRYERLRTIFGRIQTVIGDLATQGERLQYLVLWRDPRATVLFMIFNLIVTIVVYVTPLKVLALLTGFFVLRHPRFRPKLYSVPLNFMRRLPSKTDCML